MNNYQQIEAKANSRLEFMKIYGITLVAAFILMSVIQFRIEASELNSSIESIQEESVLPMPTPSPMAKADGLLPLHKLKNILVNISF